jgi:hypothetical protein
MNGVRGDGTRSCEQRENDLVSAFVVGRDCSRVCPDSIFGSGIRGGSGIGPVGPIQIRVFLFPEVEVNDPRLCGGTNYDSARRIRWDRPSSLPSSMSLATYRRDWPDSRDCRS